MGPPWGGTHALCPRSQVLLLLLSLSLLLLLLLLLGFKFISRSCNKGATPLIHELARVSSLCQVRTLEGNLFDGV